MCEHNDCYLDRITFDYVTSEGPCDQRVFVVQLICRTCGDKLVGRVKEPVTSA